VKDKQAAKSIRSELVYHVGKLLLATTFLAVAGCGGNTSAEDTSQESDREHFLSDQQKALERSKAAAKAMEEAAQQRADDTQRARDS
jgi:hypothetical protein